MNLQSLEREPKFLICLRFRPTRVFWIQHALLHCYVFTIRYLTAVWSIYYQHTHLPQPHKSSPHSRIIPQQPSRPPRLIILSGNNATIKLTTVHDHAPSSYQPRSTRIKKSHKSHSKLPGSHPPKRSLSTISKFFPFTATTVNPIGPRSQNLYNP